MTHLVMIFMHTSSVYTVSGKKLFNYAWYALAGTLYLFACVKQYLNKLKQGTQEI